MSTNTAVLITGEAGLLGSHLAEHMLGKGYKVVGVDDLSGNPLENVPVHEHLDFIRLDLNDYSQLLNLYTTHRPSVTYHFAAYAAEGLSPFIRRFNYMNNVVASASVINCCIEFDSKLVFASSAAIYGGQPIPFHEDNSAKPIDPYGVAKAAIEADLGIAGDQHGLLWSVVRPHNVIGVRQNIWDRYRNVVGIFIRQVIDGAPITIFGDGKQQRAFSDVRYLMRPLELLSQVGDHMTFNLGSDTVTTVNELALLVQGVGRKHGFMSEIKYLPERHEAKEAICDHSLARHQLEFEDRTDLGATVEEMFVWSLGQPRRTVSAMDYEISRGIYAAWQ